LLVILIFITIIYIREGLSILITFVINNQITALSKS